MKKAFAILCAFIMLIAIMAVSCSKDKNPAASSEEGTYTVEGIIHEGSSGLSGVSVRIIGNSLDQTIITDSNGYYAFSGLANGTYTITPSKSGNSFIPSSVQVTVSGADKSIEVISAATQ